MEAEHFSRTAAFVALLRGLGDRGFTTATGFREPTARALLPRRWARAFDWVAPRVGRAPRRVRERIVARADLLVLRTMAIDVELRSAVDAGCAQVVILGAGFDGRAHRMAGLERTRVFEVDHPATQAAKQRQAVAAGLERKSSELSYVAVDFERDALDERLERAGHRADEPTAWIWEGVTLYLGDDALRAALAVIAARSAPRSTLLVDYSDAEAPQQYWLARKLLLAWWSEPQIGARPQRVMRAELERVGLHVERDFALTEWGVTFVGAKPRGRQGRARLAVARTAPVSVRAIRAM